MKEIRISKEKFYDQIKKGRVNHLLKIGSRFMRETKEGDKVRIRFRDYCCVIFVKRIRFYPNVEDMFKVEDVVELLPDMRCGEAKSKLRRIFRRKKVNNNGIIVLEFSLVG